MKQYINMEQLNELTEEQKKKLRQLWQPKHGDYFWTDYYGNLYSNFMVVDTWIKGNRTIIIDYNTDAFLDKEECLPMLSIGQMLELLSNSSYKFPRMGLTELGGPHNAKVAYVISMSSKCKSFEAVELCDALWKAVKSVI